MQNLCDTQVDFTLSNLSLSIYLFFRRIVAVIIVVVDLSIDSRACILVGMFGSQIDERKRWVE